MGKSMLVKKFKDDYAQIARDRPSGPKAKLLVVELAGRPNKRRLYAQILAVIGALQNPRATIVELERTAVRLLGDLGVQVLILDEIHNVLAASWREQRVVFMTGRPDHLTDEAGAILTASIDERVYFVRSKRWIAYSKYVALSEQRTEAIAGVLWNQ